MVTRREKIILEIEDRGSGTLAQMAAQMAALDRATQQLSRSSRDSADATDRQSVSLQNLNQHLASHNGLLAQGQRNVVPMVSNTRQLGNEFDRASGRLRQLVDAGLLLGPALIPTAAQAVPAVTGLANQLGIAALAAGAAVVAFQGVGDAVGALNDYSLEPTSANLSKVGETFGRLGPAAQQFSLTVSQMGGAFADLREAAAAGLFPEVTDSLLQAGPLLDRIGVLLNRIGQAAGQQVAAGLDSLNTERWTDFFDFLGDEAGPTMQQLGEVIGNSAHALSEMWMAFQPLNRDFGDWLADITSDWDTWAQGLADNQGFQDFLDYIRNNGPRVAGTMGAIGGALLSIVEAAAPLGGPVLEALEAIANVVETIAGSDIGGPLLAGIAAMTLLTRTTRGLQAAMGTSLVGSIRTTGAGIRSLRADYQAAAASGGIWARQMGPLTQQVAAQRAQADRLRGTLKGLAAGGAVLGGLAVAATGAADGMNLTNTISLGLMGTMAGPWGAAVGAGVGLMMDLSAASDAAAASQRRLDVATRDLVDTFDPVTGLATAQTTAIIEQALAAEGAGEIAQNLGVSMTDLLGYVMGTKDGFAEFTSGLRDQGSQGERLARIMNIVSDDYYNAASASTGLAETTDELSSAYAEAANSINNMSNAWREWQDGLTAFDAETQYEAAFDALNAAVSENGASLDANSESGRAVRDALSAASTSAREFADSLPASERLVVLQEARQRVLDVAESMGLSAQEAEAWASQAQLSASLVGTATQGVGAQVLVLQGTYNQLPSAVQTDIAINGVPQTEADITRLHQKYNLTPAQVQTLVRLQSGAAEAGIRTYRQLIDSVQGTRTTTIVTRYKTEGRPAPGVGMQIAKADGGILSSVGVGRAVTAYAGGGMDRPNAHLPELTASGAPMRIWSEPETMGEAYIPLANDWRRGRAESILGQVADIFGGRFEKYADGGLRAAERTSVRTVVREGGGSSQAAAQAAAVSAQVGDLAREVGRLGRVVSNLPAEMRDLVGPAVQQGAKNGIQGRSVSDSNARWTGR